MLKLGSRALAVAAMGWILMSGSLVEAEDGFIDIEGGALFYTTKGAGEAIVVLHGGPGFDHRQFLPFIWELAADYRVILFDQRGTGHSSAPIDAESISIETFIADIERVREKFGISRMNLLGHSWGAILAMHYALRHPENLKSLVLCSTAASVESFAEMRANYEADRDPRDAETLQNMYASEEFLKGNPEAWERFWRVFFKPYFKDQSLVEKMDLRFEENTIKNCNLVAGHILRSVGEFDLHSDLSAIRCPTLVVHGEADPMPVAYARRIHQSIPGSELVELPDSGHWIFVDATQAFTRAVVRFLAGQSATP